LLKKRIIPIQLLLDGRLVKSREFGDFRDVGDPVKSSAVYNSQYADELILLNIAREQRTIAPLVSLIEQVSRVSFMPLSLGGGISTAEEAAELIRTGADKIVINSAAYRTRDVIRGTAERFGAQAVIVGIDARLDEQRGDYQLYSDCGRICENISLEQHIARCVEAGAGEIMIQSIDRDGMMQGYDVGLVRRTRAAANVPVIAAGGSGNYAHLRDLFVETDVAAAACGSLFNFSDSNPIRAKAYLSNHGLAFKVV
jgi:imidazole glycerol-phosphate synthase subunit HisF